MRRRHSPDDPRIAQAVSTLQAMIVSPEEYRALEEAQERAWDTLDALRAANANADPDEVLADVTAAVEEGRAEGHQSSS